MSLIQKWLIIYLYHFHGLGRSNCLGGNTKESSDSKLKRQTNAGHNMYHAQLLEYLSVAFTFYRKTPKLWRSLGLGDYMRWPITQNPISLELVVFKTDELSLMNMNFVPNYSEGVSCQSQRRFPEEMGESSTGERVNENSPFLINH